MTKTKPKGSLRIVSLAPSVTSILWAIGARKSLVGVTRWCKEVAPVGGLPEVGDCWTGDPAEIMALAPTLVVGSMPYKTETVGKLLENPITFLAMNPRSLAEIFADIRLLGRIVDRVAPAEKIAGKMERGFAALAKKSARDKRRQRVYCESWSNPRISSPHWVAELVKIAGGEMVVPAGQRVSDEQVAAAQPEVMVLAWAATGEKAKPETAYAVAEWKNVPAIRDRRVHVISDELLNTPGPPLLEGARQLFRILHGAPERKGRG
ncbi:MAG: ABC transporter substrate-binding protein [Acidobacteriia bacterium]|nr:ABC transporter substrate-binding protein [Terriglobia bacterium]